MFSTVHFAVLSKKSGTNRRSYMSGQPNTLKLIPTEVALAFAAPSRRLLSLVVWIRYHPLSGGFLQYWHRACVLKEAKTSEICYKNGNIQIALEFLVLFDCCIKLCFHIPVGADRSPGCAGGWLEPIPK